MVNIRMDEAVSSPFESEASAVENQNGSSRANEADKGTKVQYSIPGVLHFVQHEWARFEMERAQWEVERAELQARIAFLQGERKGQENLKNDLVRRIKMLEYALKQERMKFHRLKYGSELDLGDVAAEEPVEENPGATDMDVGTQLNSNVSWKQGRQLLRQYLQEIGYGDTILDVRSFRVRSLIGLPNDEQAASETGTPGKGPELKGDSSSQPKATTGTVSASQVQDDYDSDSEDADVGKSNDEDLKELDIVNEQFDFLANADNGNSEEWGITIQKISQMKEQYKKEAKIKKGSQRPKRTDLQNMLKNLNTDDAQFEGDSRLKSSLAEIDLTSGEKRSQASPSGMMDEGPTDIDMALGLGGLGDLAGLSSVNEPDPMSCEISSNDTSFRKTWSCQYTLKSHYDCIRAMGFHPVEAVLLTASEDGTMKLWDLQRSGQTLGNKRAATSDIEPVFTFRAHKGPILCLCMSPTGDTCYTGSQDGTIRCWAIPSPNIDPYDSFDSHMLLETLSGHDDAVWSVAFHSSDNRLVSAGADGAVKLWEPGTPTPFRRSFLLEPDDGRPTSVDFVNTDPQQLLAGYTSSAACIFDLETGKTVLNFESKEEHPANSKGQINQIVSHPTLPITITAHEDHFIRFFDNNTGKLIDAMIVHLDAVTCLSVDPNGLYLLSGSHDCSIRLWNLDNKTCIQEITAHRKKFDESIFTVAFHPSRPLLASAGADGIVKVFV